MKVAMEERAAVEQNLAQKQEMLEVWWMLGEG